MTDTTTAATTTTGDTGTTTTTTTTAAPWHQGLGTDIIGKAQQKGWDISDAQKAFAAATQAYMGAERLVGHAPEKMARIPEPTAQPAEIDAFWQRLGAPKEAKDYDLSAVKFEGRDGFSDALRAAFHANRLPKDVAAPIAQTVAKFLDDMDKAAATSRQDRINEQKEALKKSWGNNYDVFDMQAKIGFSRLAAEAGLDEKTAKEAIDSISQIAGVGAANVLKIFQVAGSKMGEGSFITMPRPGGGDMPMTREAAAAEINSLKLDQDFVRKYNSGDVASKDRMTRLHRIATGAHTQAA